MSASPAILGLHEFGTPGVVPAKMKGWVIREERFGEPVTGVDARTQEDLMGVLEREAQLGKTVLATTHDLAAAAQHFDRVIAVNRRLIASGPASLVLDSDVLARTYGGHLLVLGGQTVLLDDAHHHDSEAPGERPHFHDSDGGH